MTFFRLERAKLVRAKFEERLAIPYRLHPVGFDLGNVENTWKKSTVPFWK